MNDIEAPVGEHLSVEDIELEVIRRGRGRPVLLLHGLHTVDPRARFLDLLGRRVEIIAPSHPGFGHSARPTDFDTVYDLVRLYLDVLDALPYERVSLVGLSFGGWLAAEIAVACSLRIDRLVLVDAFGLKISDRETRISWISLIPPPRKWSGTAGMILGNGRRTLTRCRMTKS